MVHLAWPYHTPVEVYNSLVSSDLLLQRTLTLPGRRKSTRNSQWPTKRAVYLNKEDRKKLEGHNRNNRSDRRTKWQPNHVRLQAYRGYIPPSNFKTLILIKESKLYKLDFGEFKVGVLRQKPLSQVGPAKLTWWISILSKNSKFDLIIEFMTHSQTGLPNIFLELYDPYDS